jgi:integrase
MDTPKRAVRKQRLTELTVRKAQPERSAFCIWDAQQKGLALRVQPSGGKAFYAVYTISNRPRWLYLADANAVGLTDARTMAAEAMLVVAKGGDPAADRKAQRGRGTFADLHSRYLEEHAKRNNKSWRQGDALVRRHALPRWGKLQAAMVTRADVKALMGSIQAPITANQTLAAISAVFTWGMREELVSANPCKLVPRNATASRERVLSESELPKFWKALDDVDPVHAAILRTVLLTGQRPGEVRCMRREHIVDGWWQMPGEPVPSLGWPGTKNAATHRIWLPERVRGIIAEISGEGEAGFVFTGSSKGPVSNIEKAARQACTALGIEPVRPHDLRRTHGTTITKLRFGRDAMNRIQNHIEGGIADVYDVHEYSDENKLIMESVAARIMALVEGRSDDGKVIPFGR